MRRVARAARHVWAPWTAYRTPDTMQERIGNKVVGFLALELSDARHRFEIVIPDWLVQHDLADDPHIYPEASASRRLNGGAPC